MQYGTYTNDQSLYGLFASLRLRIVPPHQLLVPAHSAAENGPCAAVPATKQVT